MCRTSSVVCDFLKNDGTRHTSEGTLYRTNGTVLRHEGFRLIPAVSLIIKYYLNLKSWWVQNFAPTIFTTILVWFGCIRRGI
jgi:hypothetical protein